MIPFVLGIGTTLLMQAGVSALFPTTSPAPAPTEDFSNQSPLETGPGNYLAHSPIIPLPAPPASKTTAPAIITVTKTTSFFTNTRDPLWNVIVRLPDGKTQQFPALIGRAHKQNVNRHISGNESPLPMGKYFVTEVSSIGAGLSPELGKAVWIGLEPSFSTGRSALGMHHDPSAGKGRESGTSGCVGLIHHADTLKLAGLIRQYRIQNLLVQS